MEDFVSTMSQNPMRTVVLFQSSYCRSNSEKCDGVHRYARAAGWDVCTLQHAQATAMRRPLTCIANASDVRRAFARLRPDGCIVEGDGVVVRPVVASGVPAVFLDAELGRLADSMTCLVSDSAAIARCAARELASRPLVSAGWVPWWRAAAWSDGRGAAFAEAMSAAGVRVDSFRWPSSPARAASSLGRWLAALPRPSGVFCANDLVAEEVLRECRAAGIAVPDEISVVGVDNDEDICENTLPTLSSVEQDCFGAGMLAARLLERKMESPERAVPSAKMPVAGMVRRGSLCRTRRHDARVAAALEFVRLNATSGTSPGDVVRAMGCSRRLADGLFAELAGHSILDEIHACRLAAAKRLLRDTDMKVSAVAQMCGYSSDIDFCRVFRRREGLTPLSWRREAIA